jgi:hypothetical protein
MSISLKFPDGAERSYDDGVTPLAVAEGISKSLAKKVVAALELIRHDAAHVMAEAVQELFPRHAGDHRPGDRKRLLLRLRPQRAVHAGRLPRDRKEDEGDHRARQADSPRKVWTRDAKQAALQGQGRELQGRDWWMKHSRRARRSRSTSRANGSTFAVGRTCPRRARSARPSS